MNYAPVFLVCLAFENYVLARLEFLVAPARNGLLCVVCPAVLPEVPVPGSCLCYHPYSVSIKRAECVRNACDPANEGGIRFAMAYRPVLGFFAHSATHSTFVLSRSCRWRFAIVAISVAGSSSVASFAISSALSFPTMSMCPGTHDTSMPALLFSLRKCVAVSTNFCDSCWLDPSFSFVIEAIEDVLSANSMILACYCPLLALLAGTPLLFPVLSVAPAFRRRTFQRVSPFPRFRSSFPFLSSIVPILLLSGSPSPSPSLIRRCIQ